MLKQQITSLFDVRITSKGLIPITMPTHLRIINQLNSGHKTLSELMESRIGKSKTALFTALEELTEEKVIAKDRINGNIFYRDDSITLMSFVKRQAWNQKYVMDRMELLLDNPNTYLKILNDLTLELWKYLGINSDFFTEDFGRFVALLYENQIKGHTKEELMMNICTLINSFGLPRVTPYSFDPISIIIESDQELIEYENPDFSLVIGFILESLDRHMGHRYKVKNTISLNNNFIKITLEPNYNKVKGIENNTFPREKQENAYRFIYAIKKETNLFVPGNVNCDILYLLNFHCCCVQEIMDACGLPRSTTMQALKNMENYGLITHRKTATGGIYYFINCRIIFNRDGHVDISNAKADLSEIIMCQKTSFFDCFYFYLGTTLTALGFNNEEFWWFSGEAFMDFLINCYGLDLKKIETIVTECMRLEYVNFKMTSVMPLRIECDSPVLVADTKEGVLLYYIATFKRLIEVREERKIKDDVTITCDGKRYWGKATLGFDEIKTYDEETPEMPTDEFDASTGYL